MRDGTRRQRTRRFTIGLAVVGAGFLLSPFIAANADRPVTRQDESEPGASPAESLETARQNLLAAARRGDPDFPDGKSVKLMHFGYVGSLKTKDGPVLVVDRRSVITNMAAPRGLNFITFFDSRFSYLGKFRYIDSRPLYCEAGKLYLFGDLDGLPPGGNGNVIDLSLGYDSLKIYREYAYGSSGGIPQDP